MIMIRVYLHIIALLFLTSCTVTTDTEDFSERKNLFNRHWEFVRDIEDDVVFGNSELLNWEQISLPHTAFVEPLVIAGRQWQGTSFYRKTFIIPEQLEGKYFAVYFEGAMQQSDVYLNGRHLKSSFSGYLPFYLELTPYLIYGEENTLLIRLNNEDNPQIPPGKPLDELDFNYFSGIYRNVWLLVKDKLHISDPIGANRPAAGGLLVTFSEVSHRHVRVHVQTDVNNKHSYDAEARVDVRLFDADGREVAAGSSAAGHIGAGTHRLFNVSLEVPDPRLWSPTTPYLYDLQVDLMREGLVIDSERQRIGIRTFRFTEEGFELNGEPLFLRGTNRHQEYPYVGYALSDNAQYRDAWKIRKAGFNFVRLSHYPHSEAFMSALDELGLLSMNAIPGWQFFGDELFRERSLNDVRKMMRRDRNHASVVLWEASLNETAMPEDYMQQAHDIVYEEYPAADVYTCSWFDGVYDVFIPARQHGRPPHYWNHWDGGKPIFIAEYGDWEYYAHNAGLNQAAFADLTPEERNSRQLRGFGQRRLAQQALNFQEAHNSNRKGNPAGDANWVMFDYNRGYAPDLEASGIMDIFRLPKFTFWFYKSQARIGEFSVKAFNEPFVEIANFYSDPDFLEVKVYSNCEEVELFQDGTSVGRKSPDADEYSTHLRQPPFTFILDHFVPGELIAVGYVQGEKAVRSIRRTPGIPFGIKLWIDESNRPLAKGQNDVAFLYAAIIDEQGTVVPDASNGVDFDIKGDAVLVGYNPKKAEAGIATILIKAGDKGGSLSVTARSPGLQTARMTIQTH